MVEGARRLFPGSFALVMATGVISIVCALLGMRPIALALLVVDRLAYPALWTLTPIRVVRFPLLLVVDCSTISGRPASSRWPPAPASWGRRP